MRLMTGKRAETLPELMYQIEYFTLARAWEGLTDEEFFWEPFTTTWSIRRQNQCRTPNPFGVGEWVADFAVPEPTPVPLTTIAWLYWHIGSVPGRLCDIDLLGGNAHHGQRLDVPLPGSSPGLHQRCRGSQPVARRLAETPRRDRAGR